MGLISLCHGCFHIYFETSLNAYTSQRHMLSFPMFYALLRMTTWRRVGKWRYSSTHSSHRHWTGVVSIRLRLLYLRKNVPGTHWIGGWCPIVSLDVVTNPKFSHLPVIEPRPSSLKRVIIPTELTRSMVYFPYLNLIFVSDFGLMSSSYILWFLWVAVLILLWTKRTSLLILIVPFPWKLKQVGVVVTVWRLL
jgi:hypothetical protein